MAILLGGVALAGLRPWATSTLAPTLSVSPGLGVALGDSTVVASPASPGVGTGGIAAPRPDQAVAAPVTVSAPRQRTSQPALAVSPGRPLQSAAPVPTPSPPAAKPAPSPEPVAAAPVPAAAPEPAPAPPVVATVEGGGKGSAGGPVGSGVGGGEPERSCEGDEYVITVTFEEVEGEEIDYENDQADIVVQQLEADGSETEVQLRGDLNDVRSLVATLVSEGGCVHVDIVPQPETDSIEEPSGATAGAAEPDAIPEPVLP